MTFCGKCGTKVENNVRFCPSCGADLAAGQPGGTQAKVESAVHNFTNTSDSTGTFHPNDIAQNKAMAILAYFGFLALIPFFAAKESPYARFHALQGINLMICEIAYGIAYWIVTSLILAISWRLWFITSILSLVYILFGVIAIIGIVNAAQGKAKELPIFGKIRIVK